MTESSTNSIASANYMYVLTKNTNLSSVTTIPKRYHNTMRSMISLLLLLASMSCISILVAPEAADDEAALLAFKAAAISVTDDGYGYGDGELASWNQSSSYCSWEGVRCRSSGSGRHQRVVALDLRFRRLGGTLSPAIGNLSSLRYLNLTSNGLTGAIPSSLGRLRRLHALDLGTNAFSGEIPANLSSCTSLKTLILRFNRLHGRVPPEIGHGLTRLTELNLWNNSLTGPIPASLANLSSLGFLSLAYNQLEGTIPPGLGSIPGLLYLALAYNNLSGEPPASLYNLSSLEMLQIQGNMLRGGIPTDIGTKFPSIFYISFGINQFTGPIPPSISNLTALRILDLSVNGFSGYVPHTLGQLRALQTLFLYKNMLQANNNVGWEFITSLSNCSQLQSLLIGGNAALTGHLPSSIGNLSTTLQNLYLQESGISGSIPSTIGNLVNLNFLAVANTSVSGAIPESIGELANLVELALYSNDLSGLIPPSIGNLSKLTVLAARSNNLQGPIPPSIGELNNLYVLDLSINNLNGSIPREIFKLPLLSRYLSLSHNSLSGPLPSEVGSLQNLNRLYLSGNQLSGEIPTSIGECTVLEELWLDNNLFNGSIPQSFKGLKGLRELKMSMNKLSGTIPDALGSILNLQQLYLDHNDLSGPIPTVLQNLTSLSELDLSYNSLQGQVPKEGIFRNLTQFSITVNSELCGGILQLHLAPCHNNFERKIRKVRLKPLVISLSATGALLLLLALIVSLYRKLRQKQNLLQQHTVDEQYERVSYQALASGTNGFSESNLLGKGTFGAVYKCTFPEHGTTAAVKVFNLEQSGSSRSFEAECEALRMVRHRCLIKIITCCSSINLQGAEFKALVFEYMPNGSLHDWLHPKSDMPTQRNSLSLEQRLDIIVDIVDALDYLHNHCRPQIVHCDLKPSNILIAEDMSARVGDFGISRILPESVTATLQNSNSTIGVRGSIGYIAPEYGEGASISTLGDVYSLGILLLEIFTGRSPTDDMFTGSMDLLKFSEDGLPDRIWEIVDVAMWLQIDANDSTARSKIENCLVSTIALGISCAKKQPRERTPIQDVASKMHAIRDSYKKITEGGHGAATTLQ